MKESSLRRLRFVITIWALLLAAAGAYRSLPSAQTPAAPGVRRPIASPPPAGAVAAAIPPGIATAAELPLAADQFLAFVQPPDAAALTAALDAPAQEVRYVRINRELIEGKQSPFWQPRDTGRFVLPLPDGGSVTIVIQASESLGLRRFTSVGKLESRPDSRAVFAFNEGFLHAHVEDPALGEYELRAATADLNQFYKTDPALGQGCGTALPIFPDADALATLASRMTAKANAPASAESENPGPPAAEASSAGANVMIDLMMLHTQAVLPTMTGSARTAAIQSAFDNAVALLNSDLQASLCQARVRLVHIMEVNYQGDDLTTPISNWESTLLTSVRGTTDGVLDNIHAVRDQVGADLVCIVHNRRDTATGGLGYLYQSDETYSSLNALYGFSTLRYGLLTFEHILSHELGHNFGASHNREDSTSGGTPAFSYSYGYRYTAASGSKYRDIMSYDSSPASFTFLPYYSTPLVTPSASPGSPIGVAAGLSGEADVARTIDQTAFDISQFRLQMQAPATNGTLYAVSTRAFVGTASEQQLIGAFIVSGPTGSTKRMLVRGNGPALAGAVPNFLPNPKLTLYRLENGGSTVVAVNDDWGTNTNAAAVATAGGTSAAANSLDAALLIDLAPGIYTANVTSSDGRTGVSLVEAYEVTTAGTKVTALSTRGYSSTDQVMIAGFIVSGTAGTTKRIVIRGQGPNLARQDVSGAMSDPYLELYNSTGDRIMLNDDWAVQNVSNSTDDFRPLASYYSELQIATAGMAPANRREPCIIVDLPPGLYTAILKPFQFTPTVAGTPGVALVEVYEIP
jgi:hypothetical protein